MTPKQWTKFLETGEVEIGAMVYYPWPDTDMPKGKKYFCFHWTGCKSHQELRDAGILCRTATEANQRAGIMLAAVRKWREKR